MCPELPSQNEEQWRKLLTEGHRRLRVAHWLFRHLPSPPRCKVCHNPFGGIGGSLVGLVGFTRSRNRTLGKDSARGLARCGAHTQPRRFYQYLSGLLSSQHRSDMAKVVRHLPRVTWPRLKILRALGKV